MKKLPVLLTLLAAAVLLNARAASLDGISVPDSAVVGGKPLVLNGVGLRTKFFFRIYVGALYLPQKAGTAAAVMSQNGPDRILMHMIYAVSKNQFADAWHEGFKDNNPSMSPGLQADIAQFIGYFGDSRKGDVITLDYVPGQGTQVNWNGQTKGSIPGEDFHQALLNVFLGPNPPTESLKKSLLGGG
jgi:hypothetical protein